MTDSELMDVDSPRQNYMPASVESVERTGPIMLSLSPLGLKQVLHARACPSSSNYSPGRQDTNVCLMQIVQIHSCLCSVAELRWRLTVKQIRAMFSWARCWFSCQANTSIISTQQHGSWLKSCEWVVIFLLAICCRLYCSENMQNVIFI